MMLMSGVNFIREQPQRERTEDRIVDHRAAAAIGIETDCGR